MILLYIYENSYEGNLRAQHLVKYFITQWKYTRLFLKEQVEISLSNMYATSDVFTYLNA